MSYDELLDEIENICYSGTKLKLDYYIDHALDDDKQDEGQDINVMRMADTGAPHPDQHPVVD